MEQNQPTSYCDAAKNNEYHRHYHDNEYGFPQQDESILLERLVLEIMQAGLSWDIILKKREGFYQAFEGYDVNRIADYGEEDRARLLADARIVRNKLKVNAVIHNANVIKNMRQSDGGFHGWLAAHHPLTKADWVRLFKKTFKFTGGEITNEFLMSIGFLPGTHIKSCPVYQELHELRVPWVVAEEEGFEYVTSA